MFTGLHSTSHYCRADLQHLTRMDARSARSETDKKIYAREVSCDFVKAQCITALPATSVDKHLFFARCFRQEFRLRHFDHDATDSGDLRRNNLGRLRRCESPWTFHSPGRFHEVDNRRPGVVLPTNYLEQSRPHLRFQTIDLK